MAIYAQHNDTRFGVGDKVRVTQKVDEGGKTRSSIFEGMVISIKGRDSKTFTVRRVGAQRVGIERIYPLELPSIEKIEVIKKGTPGVRHAKLYFTRGKNPRQIDEIYTKAARRSPSKEA